MKAIDIIRKVDELEPNQFGADKKLAWLSELDGQIYLELSRVYEPCMSQPGKYVPGEEELLVEEPYAQGVYSHFLQAMMAAENYETGKYNQHITLFDSSYRQYAKPDRRLRCTTFSKTSFSAKNSEVLMKPGASSRSTTWEMLSPTMSTLSLSSS